MKYSYWLSNIPGIGNGKIRCLLSECKTAEEIYGASYDRLSGITGITKQDVETICESINTWNLDEEWMKLMETGVGFVSFEQENYPRHLKHIYDAPYGLYYIGHLPEEEQKSVAIVGARGRSAYGSEIASFLAKTLSNHGVQVISGLAKGIDTDAHQGALEGGTATFAVLGCGIDVCYPRSNRYLYEKIIQNGGIISEYPIGTSPRANFFPARNRIISGLSDCVVVVEAREKSGSLITADFAMEQGKDVYAIPGRITDSLSQGCNHLIKQGAGLIHSVEDFLADLDILTKNDAIQMNFCQKLLEKDESLVYSVTDFQPIDLESLLDKTGISLCDLLEILHKLESLGLIKEVFVNHYVRTIDR